MCCTGLAPRQAQHTLLGNNSLATDLTAARVNVLTPATPPLTTCCAQATTPEALMYYMYCGTNYFPLAAACPGAHEQSQPKIVYTSRFVRVVPAHGPC